MKGAKSASRSVTNLVSILVLYMLLAIGLLVFANRIFLDPSLTTNMPYAIVVAVLAAIPVFLGVLLVINIRRLIVDRVKRDSGARVKTRLVLYMALIISLASVPQAALSLSAVNSVVEAWFSEDIGAALHGSLSLALEVYQERIDSLKTFATEELGAITPRYGEKDYKKLAEMLLRQRPELVSVQIFDSLGNEKAFSKNEEYLKGREAFKLKFDSTKGDGFLPRVYLSGMSVVPYLAHEQGLSNKITIVLVLGTPEGYDEKTDSINAAIVSYDKINQARPYFQSVFGVFILLFSLPLVLFSMLIAFFLADSIMKPIASLADAMKKVSGGDLSYRVLSRSRDELSGLIDSFNKMVEEIQKTRDASIATERINIWQDLAQRLAHELKNPLTPIKLSAERVLKKAKTDPDDLQRVIQPSMIAIIQEVDALSSLLTEFRNFARLPEPQLEWSNLATIVEESVTLFASSYSGVTFDTKELPKDIVIRIDRNHIKQVLSNLFLNAIEAMAGSGSVKIRADLVKKADSKYCRLQIQDTGSGIPESIRETIFTPYFTTKQSGTGLGLSIVEHIVVDHRGRIWFETEEGTGTTFFIDLPLESS